MTAVELVMFAFLLLAGVLTIAGFIADALEQIGKESELH
jgi:hypothetical protein